MWFLGSYKCKLCVWTSGLKHLDQGCQTRGLCSPSGPFEADSLGPSVKVKNGSKKLTGVFVLVTSLAVPAAVGRPTMTSPPHSLTEMLKVIVEQVIWDSPGGPEEKVLLLMLSLTSTRRSVCYLWSISSFVVFFSLYCPLQFRLLGQADDVSECHKKFDLMFWWK